MIVLDPKRLHGHGPTSERYRPSDMEGSSELAYLRIKNTALGQYFRSDTQGPVARFFRLVQGRELIRLIVDDVRGFEQEAAAYANMRFDGKAFWFGLTFDYNLNPVSIITYDNWDTLADTLYARGAVPYELRPPSYLYDVYLPSLRWWNGTEWSATKPMLPWEVNSASTSD